MKQEMTFQEKKSLINSVDSNGATLLHYVTALNYYELIPLLHENGADINIKTTRSSLTPLMVAAAKGHEKSVKKLMRLGAVFWNDFENDGSKLTKAEDDQVKNESIKSLREAAYKDEDADFDDCDQDESDDENDDDLDFESPTVQGTLGTEPNFS